MKDIFLWLFTPERNHYVVIGLILTILGVLLIPVIIGIPIAGIGFCILIIGIMISFAQKFSTGKKVAQGFKKMFSQMKGFLQKLLN